MVRTSGAASHVLVVSLLLPALASAAVWEEINFNLPADLQIVGTVPGKKSLVAFIGNGQKNGNQGSGWSLDLAGRTWNRLGTGAGSGSLYLFPFGVLIDPVHPDTFWVWGNYGLQANGGLYQSTDGGTTLRHNPPQSCGQSWCEAEWLSVDFSDPARKTWLIGEHETPQSVRKSVDGGKTWTQVGKSLPAGSGRSQYPLILDSETFLIGCSFTVPYGTDGVGGTPGVYRTADGGASWGKVSNEKVFQAPLMVGDTVYWTFFNGTDGGILKSMDKGKTWTKSPAAGMNYRSIPIRLPDGSLVMIDKAKSLVRSVDGAKTWSPMSPPIPVLDLASPHSVLYNAAAQAFIVWQKGGKVVKLDYPVTPTGLSPRASTAPRSAGNAAKRAVSVGPPQRLPPGASGYTVSGAQLGNRRAVRPSNR